MAQAYTRRELLTARVRGTNPAVQYEPFSDSVDRFVKQLRTRRNVARLAAGAAATAALNRAYPQALHEPGQRVDVFTKVYDGHFAERRGVAEKVASVLYPLTLDEALRARIIPRHFGFPMPAGWKKTNSGLVYKRPGSAVYTINGKGQKTRVIPSRSAGYSGRYYVRDGVLWKDSIGAQWDRKLRISRRELFRNQKRRFLRYFDAGRQKRSSLDVYTDKYLVRAINVLKEIYENLGRRIGNSYEREMVKAFVEATRPHTLNGITVRELFPRANEAALFYILDNALRFGGERFVEGIPAQWDPFSSNGPFQMTDIPMAGVYSLNPYVSRQDRVPRFVHQFNGIRHHANAAVMNEFKNVRNLASALRKKGNLKAFLRDFEKLDERERFILVSGLAGALHHLPGPTMSRVLAYSKYRAGRPDMHLGLPDTLGRWGRGRMRGRLKEYYNSTARAALFGAYKFERLYARYGDDRAVASAPPQPSIKTSARRKPDIVSEPVAATEHATEQAIQEISKPVKPASLPDIAGDKIYE